MDDLTGDSPTTASTLPGAGGMVAGRYRVRARLGRGATKEVYLAYDERLDREVALAIVVGAAGSDVARARVAREAQVTGRLGDHPNVITVYDTGELDGVPYLVLRAMSGGSLAAAIGHERPSLADALRIGGEIAAALAHAHAHDVLHRDVKPDNVWLAADGTAALGDFGIAHVAGADRLTAEGVVVGTVRYLSPEQIRGEPADAASDLYALGVTLYELVAGRPPFTAEDPAHVLTQHLTAAPVPPSRHAPKIAPALEELILALLAKERERRPPSAAAVRAALAQIAAAGEAAEAAGGRSPTASPGPLPEARRLVAVLAARADVPDPEVLHGVLQRCTAVVEQHGGSVEHLLGEALVGIFGLTGSHGDDALRAARAAIELRAASPQLRLGAESGEIFLGSGPRGAATATGTPITAAGRLAERATAGEILLGDDIRAALAPEARIDADSGRLLELRADLPALLRTPATPFVGREAELAQLRTAFEQACERRGCRLVTVAGPPGIGKSRLAGEFLAAIGDEATVLAGRCLAYGEGTTYRALTDIVRGLGGEPRARLTELLDGDEQAVRGILGAIGPSDEPVQAGETAWALRRLLERLARDRPLVVAVEDIHWAEPVLLELLEHVVALSSGSPILVLCLTRPELLETRPAWAAPQPNRSVLVLDALGDAQARELAERLGAGAPAARIARRAEGNPLFVEQLVAVDAGHATTELPASIQAVLAARIDSLAEGERTPLRHAAVEGRTFHAGALAQLLSDGDGDGERPGAGDPRAIDARLVGLARRGLIGADRPEFPGEDAFRFTHALIREAAYAGLPKVARARLHARLAGWLEQRPAAADEIVGYHLERACLLAGELGRHGEPERRLAARAVQRLERAAHAALGRGAPAAASALLRRAIALTGPDDAARADLLPALGAALFEEGEMAAATRVLDEAIAASSDARAQARARVERELVRLETEPSATTDEIRAVTDTVMPVLERAADDHGLSRVWLLRGQLAWNAGRVEAADLAWREAADCAQRAGDQRGLFEVVGWRATAAALGPAPVDEAIARCAAFGEVVRASPFALAATLNPLALLHAMQGDAARAEALLEQAGQTLRELGGLGAGVSHLEAFVRLTLGQPERIVDPLRADVETLSSMSDASALATTTALLAQALFAQGDTDEADALCTVSAEGAATDDIITQVTWRGVRARIRARDGRLGEAEALAREAVQLVSATDLLAHHGDAMLDLAEVLGLSGAGQASGEAARTGFALHERKGNAMGAARARSLLDNR